MYGDKKPFVPKGKSKYGPWGESIAGKKTTPYLFVRLLRRVRHSSGRCRAVNPIDEQVEVCKWCPLQGRKAKTAAALKADKAKTAVPAGRLRKSDVHGKRADWVSLGVFESVDEAIEIIEQEVEIMEEVEDRRQN